jgi:hypothetical protein
LTTGGPAARNQYVDAQTEYKRSAPLKLNAVMKKICQIIATAD